MSTNWPTRAEVAAIVAGMGVTIPARVTTALQDQLIDAAIANFKQHTKRTWVTVQEERFFNGSGTGEMELDDFVSITEVNIMGVAVVTALPLENIYAVQVANFPSTRIQIYQGSMFFYNNQWMTRFPPGRSNISVDALWGWGSTLPSDVWLAVAYQSAAMIANLINYDITGYLIKWTEADVTEVRNRYDPFQFFLGGNLSYKSVVNMYKLPASRYMRRQVKVIM